MCGGMGGLLDKEIGGEMDRNKDERFEGGNWVEV